MSTALDVETAVGKGVVRHEFSVLSMVWWRELLRFFRVPVRIAVGLIQPVLFLFVLGYGLGPVVQATLGFDFKKYVFAGVLAMSVVSTAMVSGVSVAWDREFGFMREMLAAPVSRVAIIAGKIGGGTTIATAQGTLMLFLAPLIGVHLTVVLVFQVIGLEALMAAAISSLGVWTGTRVQRIEAFQVIVQVVMLPMIFLSGSAFPLYGLPVWMTVITRLNPLTYAIYPLRQAILSAQHIPATLLDRFSTTVTLFGWTVPTGVADLIVALFAVVFFVLASTALGRSR